MAVMSQATNRPVSRLTVPTQSRRLPFCAATRSIVPSGRTRFLDFVVGDARVVVIHLLIELRSTEECPCRLKGAGAYSRDHGEFRPRGGGPSIENAGAVGTARAAAGEKQHVDWGRRTEEALAIGFLRRSISNRFV